MPLSASGKARRDEARADHPANRLGPALGRNGEVLASQGSSDERATADVRLRHDLSRGPRTLCDPLTVTPERWTAGSREPDGHGLTASGGGPRGSRRRGPGRGPDVPGPRPRPDTWRASPGAGQPILCESLGCGNPPKVVASRCMTAARPLQTRGNAGVRARDGHPATHRLAMRFASDGRDAEEREGMRRAETSVPRPRINAVTRSPSAGRQKARVPSGTRQRTGSPRARAPRGALQTRR